MLEYNSIVLAVMNQKGGPGKTTVTNMLAEYFAIKAKLNVLVVDLDLQCNASEYWYGMDISPESLGGQLPPIHPDYDDDPELEERSTIADIFYGKAVLPFDTYICKNNGFKKTVQIMMGHPAKLEKINNEFDNQSGQIESRVINRLHEFLHMPEMREYYDIILLDTSPSRTPIFRSALRAATHTIIPFECEEKSLQGINAMLQIIESENFTRSDENKVNLVGLLPNKVRIQTNLHRSNLDLLYGELGSVMFPQGVYLPHSTAFPERDLKGIKPRTIFSISKNHTAYKHSVAVGNYVKRNIFG
jgi:chromosome partitioning protein